MKRAGFTLIEVLVVLVVVSLLATLVGPMLLGHVTEARSQTARTQIDLLGLALDAYRLDNATYPTTEQGLDALWIPPTVLPIPPRWRGPYTRKSIPRDPWGNAYLYESPSDSSATGYGIQSLGRDGRAGGEREDADIASWRSEQ